MTLNVLTVVLPALSVAVTSKELVVAASTAVGVPDTTLVDALNAVPAGTAPDVKAYVTAPPSGSVAVRAGAEDDE